MNNNIKDIDALMVRYLQETCTEEEKSQFISWLGDDEENEASYFQMKEIFDTRERIRISGEDTRKMPRTAKRHRKLVRITPWMRHAAVLAILFGGGIFYFVRKSSPADSIIYVKQIVIHNTRGVYPVTLPDNSEVWLHGGTTLTYPEQFSDSIRAVNLRGEAYFSVQADASYPFVVQTSNASIHATGTEFNITAYPGDGTTTTTLVKGIVDIHSDRHPASVQLKPNQQAVVNTNDIRIRVADANINEEKAPADKEIAVIVQDISADLYTDWKDGVYRFKNEPLQNIILRLERMYGMDIRIEDEDLAKAFFSGMFTTDYSLKEVFDIINISNPISYAVKDKVVYVKNRR